MSARCLCAKLTQQHVVFYISVFLAKLTDILFIKIKNDTAQTLRPSHGHAEMLR